MKKKQIKYIPIEPSYVRPSAGCGQDPDPDVLYVRPMPVNPQPQPIKHSNTEEIDAVVQTCGELLSDLWWGGCFFFVSCLIGNLEECSNKTDAQGKSFPKVAVTREDRQNTTRTPYVNQREYSLIYIQAKAQNKPFLLCPVCNRRVTKLFIFAHGAREADEKLNSYYCACGYCTSNFIADEYMVVIPNTAIVAHKNPNEYLLFFVDTRALDEPLCPVCKSRVTKLFIIARDIQEADVKINRRDYACGYCTCSLIADENMVIRTNNT